MIPVVSPASKLCLRDPFGIHDFAQNLSDSHFTGAKLASQNPCLHSSCTSIPCTNIALVFKMVAILLYSYIMLYIYDVRNRRNAISSNNVNQTTNQMEYLNSSKKISFFDILLWVATSYRKLRLSNRQQSACCTICVVCQSTV